MHTVKFLLSAGLSDLHAHPVHHLPELLTPIILIVSAVGCFLQVLHVMGKHKVAQGEKVTVGLR